MAAEMGETKVVMKVGWRDVMTAAEMVAVWVALTGRTMVGSMVETTAQQKAAA